MKLQQQKFKGPSCKLVGLYSFSNFFFKYLANGSGTNQTNNGTQIFRSKFKMRVTGGLIMIINILKTKVITAQTGVGERLMAETIFKAQFKMEG